jgi:hypothetical protein
MNRARQSRIALLVPAALVVSLLWSTQVFAGAVSLTLVRASLTNVDDAAGRWQHEGGTITKGAVAVGQYAIHRRITTGGTVPQNTAMETITLFFLQTGVPAQNVTLQGAHAFANGRFAGSVSAASNRYSWIIGGDATIAPTRAIGTSTLGIFWTGANQLTLP